jgi:hypothetical protein
VCIAQRKGINTNYIPYHCNNICRACASRCAPDADAVLDLPAIFMQCYDNGGYGDLIDYRSLPAAPAILSAEEAAWVDGLLKGKGLRPA